MTGKKPPRHDSDIHKGAMEDDLPGSEHNTSLAGQLPHRGGGNEMIRGNDSDYPEPGENPEHTGEPEEDPEAQKRPPASEQKRKPSLQKEDSRAS